MPANTIAVTLESRKNVADLRKTGIHPEHWYPLARSRDIKSGKAIGKSFAGESIVLVRTASGKIFALEDRCAQRQVPLHAGVVNGEQIQCCYHGWVYDSNGSCVNIPYAGKNERIPHSVRSYPCKEAYGLIFVFPGDRNKAEDAFFPHIPAKEDRH
ncbi:MAG: Rieske (2Fe-2S) protein [Nitrosomonas sp.]|nr:Rieske (2Fe-2S) protein [Nitrosomonas sp.]MDP1951860.1 Rieske (2Fe-2S) protein [Nitrosomonas sp.]